MLSAKPSWIYLHCTSCVITVTISGVLLLKTLLNPHRRREIYRCLQENDQECPNCAREHGLIREIRSNNEKLADQHDVFLAEVQEKGFEAVASGFSRGILNISKTEV